MLQCPELSYPTKYAESFVDEHVIQFSPAILLSRLARRKERRNEEVAQFNQATSLRLPLPLLLLLYISVRLPRTQQLIRSE